MLGFKRKEKEEKKRDFNSLKIQKDNLKEERIRNYMHLMGTAVIEEHMSKSGKLGEEKNRLSATTPNNKYQDALLKTNKIQNIINPIAPKINIDLKNIQSTAIIPEVTEDIVTIKKVTS